MSDGTCSVESCEGRIQARGWCGKHYKRYLKTGDPLTTVQRTNRVYPDRTCTLCGKTFSPAVYNQKRCSPKCTRRAARLRAGARKRGGPVPKSVPCAICGAEFPMISTRQRYCSRRCRMRAKDQYRRYRAESKRNTVYERDENVCQLCLMPVDTSIPYPHPLAATLDHIVPVTAGGTHDIDNLQLAHMACNASKGGASRLHAVSASEIPRSWM